MYIACNNRSLINESFNLCFCSDFSLILCSYNFHLFTGAFNLYLHRFGQHTICEEFTANHLHEHRKKNLTGSVLKFTVSLNEYSSCIQSLHCKSLLKFSHLSPPCAGLNNECKHSRFRVCSKNVNPILRLILQNLQNMTRLRGEDRIDLERIKKAKSKDKGILFFFENRIRTRSLKKAFQ